MVAEGVALRPVVNVVFNPALKGKEIVLRVIISYLVSPLGCNIGFLAVIGPKEFFAQGKDLFFIFGLYFIKVIFCNFSDKRDLYPVAYRTSSLKKREELVFVFSSIFRARSSLILVIMLGSTVLYLIRGVLIFYLYITYI